MEFEEPSFDLMVTKLMEFLMDDGETISGEARICVELSELELDDGVDEDREFSERSEVDAFEWANSV